jgi:hypothetical protein
MDTYPQPLMETQESESMWSPKNVVIMVLVVLLLLSFLGINLLDILSNFIKLLIKLFGPIVSQILALLGYTTGTVLNKSADVVSDVSKEVIDIAEGTVQNVGDLMIKASKANVDYGAKSELDQALNMRMSNTQYPNSDIAENPIQKPISSNKNGWCYIGEYENRRKCIEVAEHDKCMSGQVFPSQQVCLNPTMTQNA